MTILLVDDDRTIVDIFKYGLSERGYEVHTAYTAADALKIAKTIKIDCLLSDIQLPDQDGIALNTMIRLVYPDVISILMTGYPGISSAIKGLRQNIHDYLIKPFSVEQAIASIERSITNDTLRRTNHDLMEQIAGLRVELKELQKQIEELSTSGAVSATETAKHVDQARAHKIYLEQQGRLK